MIGTSWKAGSYLSDPLNEDLADPDNWIAAYADTRLIPMVQIVSTNTKFSMLQIDPDDRFVKHPSVVTAGDGTTL